MSVGGPLKLNPQGYVYQELLRIKMNPDEFATALQTVANSGNYHPRFKTYYNHMLEHQDLPESDVAPFFLHTFGTIYQYNKTRLGRHPNFWADRQCKINEGFQDKLDMTSFDDRDHYDQLEKIIRDWCASNPAPRKKQDLIKLLEKLFKDEDSGFQDLELEDLEFLGQMDYVIQQGPQAALLAHMNQLTFYNNEWLPLDPPGDFPDPLSGETIAHCFWGPVRKYKHKGEWIVSKCINLAKLRTNLSAQQRFNDYPPSEIASHRYMQNCFHYDNPGMKSCPYICKLKGITEDSQSKNIFYWMEFGTDYFSEIASGYNKELKKWKKFLRENNLGRSHIRSTKSPWEKKRCLDFIKLARGMEFMHKLGIAHRDFKLENTIMGLDGDVKIIDFGVGHRFGFWEQKNYRCVDRVGTATYMSPECSLVKRSSRTRDVRVRLEQYDHWDARANDIWTLGVALFMMLFACPPYDTCGNTDTRFVYLTSGVFMPQGRKIPPNANLKSLLKAYSRLAMVSDDCMDFLARFFLPERQRITWDQIWSHRWVQEILDQAP